MCVCIQFFSNSITCSGKTNAGSMHVLKFLTYPDDKLWLTHKLGCQQYEPKKGYCTENWQLSVVQQQAEVCSATLWQHHQPTWVVWQLGSPKRPHCHVLLGQMKHRMPAEGCQDWKGLGYGSRVWVNQTLAF